MAGTNTITQISTAGDGYAIGRTLGARQGEAIRQRVFATEEFQALARNWKGSERLGQLAAAARAEFPRYLREIEGIADGAGLDFETVFLWNCRGDLRIPPDGAEAEGCTSVLRAPAGDGAALIAHNEDGAAELLGHCYWVSVTPDDGPAFESFMYPGMLPGHTFGANAAGLVQTINNIRVHDLQPGVPRQIITRAVLGCRDLDAALGLLRRTDRASGFHHCLGQAGARRVVSVEAPASGCRVREIDGVAVHANHLIHPDFAGTDQEITLSSERRQRRGEEMIAADPATEAETVLFDGWAPTYRTDDGGDDYAQPLATGVFRLHADRVDWTVHAGPDAPDVLGGRLGLAAAA